MGVVLALTLALATAACSHGQAGFAARQMISAANPHAARAGLEILRAGGSAVDAAIAAQMVLTLVEPQSSGIGGGAFLLNFSPGRPDAGVMPDLDAYDGREIAPASATDTMFMNAFGQPLPMSVREAGGRSVGVPGLLRMLEAAHKRHGRLPWAHLFEPAIRLAEQGFAVSPRLHELIRQDPHLKRFPEARRYFFTPKGEPLPAGTILRNPALSDTFRLIAQHGADAFYEGDIADAIVSAVNKTSWLPGDMARMDLVRYRARVRQVVCRPYRVWRICGMPPPTSGGIATLQILGMLERFDMSRIAAGSPLAVHLITEASRLAFADRNSYVADPDFVAIPVDGLLDRGYLRQRSEAILGTQSIGKALPGVPPQTALNDRAPDDATDGPVSTSHISVVDARGNAVSMTTTIGMPFGSRLMVRGFMLNDELTDFSAMPQRDGQPVANRPGPRKRPRSSMAPTIVTDEAGRLVFVIGSPGGSNIIGYVTKALIGVLDWDMDVQDALALPNFVNRNGPTDLEQGTELEQIGPVLEALGHTVRVQPKTSGLHGIRVRGSGLEGGADPRREGVAIGD